MSAPTGRSARTTSRADPVTAAASELARAAAVAAGGANVGEHRGSWPEGDRVVTHTFDATVPGYRGWQWSVTLARAPRSRKITVDEVVLLPGPGALLAPEWVPWSERVRAGDLAPGDLLPSAPDDARIVPAYLNQEEPSSPVDLPQIDQVAFELGLGRARVMSRWGREEAAQRWAEGNGGPGTAMARHAPGRCAGCAFYLPLLGSLGAYLGACGNEFADTDGRVVTADHGCGAHSEAVAAAADAPGELAYDDGEIITGSRLSGAPQPAVTADHPQSDHPEGSTGEGGP